MGAAFEEEEEEGQRTSFHSLFVFAELGDMSIDILGNFI